MALATTDIVFTTPLAIYILWINTVATPIGPWRSWEDTHFGFERVEQYPAVLWRKNNLLSIAMESTRWASVVCALIFFGFFGFAEEARRNYTTAFWKVAGLCGLRQKQTSKGKVPIDKMWALSSFLRISFSSHLTFAANFPKSQLPLLRFATTTMTTSTTNIRVLYQVPVHGLNFRVRPLPHLHTHISSPQVQH